MGLFNTRCCFCLTTCYMCLNRVATLALSAPASKLVSIIVFQKFNKKLQSNYKPYCTQTCPCCVVRAAHHAILFDQLVRVCQVVLVPVDADNESRFKAELVHVMFVFPNSTIKHQPCRTPQEPQSVTVTKIVHESNTHFK